MILQAILLRLDKLKQTIKSPYLVNILLRYRVIAALEHRFILGKSLMTVVDIGANRGQFALVARIHFPGARIFSFEPLKEPADVFRRIFADDRRTTLYEVAIGPEDTESTIHVSKADDSSSLLPISTLQNELYPGTAEKETRSIIVKPLDAILSSEDIQTPAILKIDVQGYEKQVLEGCKSILPLFSFVYVECSFFELYKGQALAHEIISFLSENGFVLRGVYNLDKDKNGIPVQGDFLFSRE